MYIIIIIETPQTGLSTHKGEFCLRPTRRAPFVEMPELSLLIGWYQQPRGISKIERKAVPEIFHQTHPAVFAAKYFSARRPHFHPGSLNVCRAHKDSVCSPCTVLWQFVLFCLFFVVYALADWSRLFRGVAKSWTGRVRHVPRFWGYWLLFWRLWQESSWRMRQQNCG